MEWRAKEMKENFLLVNKAAIGSLISVFILCSASMLVPPVLGSRNIEEIQKIQDNLSIENNIFLSNIENNKVTIKYDFLDSLNKYLISMDLLPLSIDAYSKFYNEIENEYGKELIKIYLGILNYFIREANSYDLSINEVYKKFKSDIAFDGFKQTNVDKVRANTEISESFDQDIPIPTQKKASNFEEYWEWYRKGKIIWAGNFVNADGESIRTPSIVFNFWKGTNFHEWYYEAADYIWGIQGVTKYSQFRILNWLLFWPSIACGAISLIGFLSGFLMSSVEGYAIGSLFGLAGIICLILLIYNDYYIFLYYLFGTNAFMMMFEWGNINPIIEIKSNDPGVFSSCKVTAINNDVEKKYIETGGVFGNNNGDPVTWSLEEFEYDLHIESEQTIDEKIRTYSISYPDYYYNDHSKNSAHKQWEKAVPPPGNWTITIEAPGYKTITRTITNAEPRTDYHLIVELEKI